MDPGTSVAYIFFQRQQSCAWMVYNAENLILVFILYTKCTEKLNLQSLTFLSISIFYIEVYFLETYLSFSRNGIKAWDFQLETFKIEC